MRAYERLCLSTPVFFSWITHKHRTSCDGYEVWCWASIYKLTFHKVCLASLSLSLSLYTYIHIYIYIYNVCVCVCVCYTRVLMDRASTMSALLARSVWKQLDPLWYMAPGLKIQRWWTTTYHWVRYFHNLRL